jgi:hypothetical protein
MSKVYIDLYAMAMLDQGGGGGGGEVLIDNTSSRTSSLALRASAFVLVNQYSNGGISTMVVRSSIFLLHLMFAFLANFLLSSFFVVEP